jgi:polysaccharide biosynthesis transport protein
VVASLLISRLREQEMQLVQTEAELATTYGPKHPRVEELRRQRSDVAAGINAEVKRIARSLEHELTVIRTREQNLAREIEGVRSERTVEDQTEVRLRQLEREAAAKRTVYETFLARHQELRAREGFQVSNVRVLAPARVPLEPSSPSPVFFAAVGFTASTVLGCMLGLLREQLDKSLRSERQVERTLGLPCLGVVPQVRGLKRGRDVLAGYLCGKPRSAYAEGIRALYAALLVTDGGADPPLKVILLTSALPGEGKTATASSLAVSAARTGQKVLLVDFDLRRPNVAREFGHRPPGGVVEVITGAQRLDEALISNEATGIHILPVRSSPADTTALLTSQRIRALLDELRQRYDFVVLDSPPLLAVTDARLLALHTDATVFVVRWERTKVDAAAAALKVLRDAGARIAGAVLTQVHLKKHSRFRYGDGVQYYASYSGYYQD